MVYPIVLFLQDNNSYLAAVPDLFGCYAVGTTFAEAMDNIRKEIDVFLLSLIRNGGSIPESKGVNAYLGRPDYVDGTWAAISFDHHAIVQAATQ